MIQSRYSLSSLFLSFISLLAILGSLVYIAFGLTTLSCSIVLVLSALSCLVLNRYFQKIESAALLNENFAFDRYNILLTVMYVMCFFLGIYFLYTNRSNYPLISPWEVVPPIMFLLYTIATASLLFLTNHLKQSLISVFLGFHLLWSFSVALIIYSIGYGYDPFIHQAAVQSIKQLGQIFPITFYYLGQYSLISVANNIFGGSIHFWDKILVPVLASVFLSISFLRLKRQKIISSFASVILLLIFSFSIFIVTTPQNLAYIFLITLILWSIKIKNSKELFLSWLLALATFMTHPIAGIPAIIFATSISSQFINNAIVKKIFTFVTTSGYILILPLAFYVFSQANSETIMQWQWPNFSNLFSFIIIHNPIKEVWWLNSLYFFQSLQGLVYLMTLVGGAILVWRAKLWTYFTNFGLPIVGLLLSAIISSAISFHFLIDYERSDYAQRILLVAGFFSLPFIIVSFENFIEKLRSQTIYIQITLLLLISTMITVSLYFSYPRFDNYYNTHGYATSAADIEAVHWINDNAGKEDYIVLANQQVSAAALREFGFKKYYNSFFYYPVPTGGPLYQYYLKMVEKPSQSTVEEAMKLAGVKKAFFVLNDYWWAADKLGPEAGAIADQSITLSQGQIMVFKYSAQ